MASNTAVVVEGEEDEDEVPQSEPAVMRSGATGSLPVSTETAPPLPSSQTHTVDPNIRALLRTNPRAASMRAQKESEAAKVKSNEGVVPANAKTVPLKAKAKSSMQSFWRQYQQEAFETSSDNDSEVDRTMRAQPEVQQPPQPPKAAASTAGPPKPVQAPVVPTLPPRNRTPPPPHTDPQSWPFTESLEVLAARKLPQVGRAHRPARLPALVLPAPTAHVARPSPLFETTLSAKISIGSELLKVQHQIFTTLYRSLEQQTTMALQARENSAALGEVTNVLTEATNELFTQTDKFFRVA